MSEATLSKYIYNKAKALGCMVVKIDASHRGWPDRLILHNGKCMFIEVKNPNGRGRLSKLQRYTIERIKSIGIQAFVIDNKNMANEVLYNFIKQGDNDGNTKYFERHDIPPTRYYGS